MTIRIMKIAHAQQEEIQEAANEREAAARLSTGPSILNASMLREVMSNPAFQERIAEEMRWRIHNTTRAIFGLSPVSQQQYADQYSFRGWKVKQTLRRLKRKPNHKRNRNR